jgi:isopropylmalate/homocitrate/citramalate synthase
VYAKWENIKDKLKMIKEEIEKMYQKGNSTQELWDYFKKELEESIDENRPQKTAKIKDGKPWFTRI